MIKNLKLTSILLIREILLLLLLPSASFAQDKFQDSILQKYGYRQYQINKQNDTIYFYVNQRGHTPKKHMVLFLGGSDPQPLFSYEYVNGQLKSYVWGHKDYLNVPEDYIYVVIAKPGMEGVWNEKDLSESAPVKYLDKNSLDYRVWQADHVIDYCRRKLLARGGKTIVYGHSEGFNVVSKLLTVNKKITHAGLWAGSAMPDYFDFMMFRRKSVTKGELSDSAATREIDALLIDYQDIFANPTFHKPGSIYTNKRWISYAESPVNHLVKVKIPIYMLASTLDDNAPYENSFIVPLEFIRLGKTNLTLRTCIGCDHSLNIKTETGDKLSYWNEYFKDFLKWTDTLK